MERLPVVWNPGRHRQHLPVCRNAVVLALILFVGLAGAASPQPPAPYEISVNVDLVVLQATVLNRKGAVAAGLSEQDFELYQGGFRQSNRTTRVVARAKGDGRLTVRTRGGYFPLPMAAPEGTP